MTARRKTPGQPSKFLAGVRASLPEITKAIEAGRWDVAERIQYSNRNTASFEEAVHAGDWVEALSFRRPDKWTAITAVWLREHEFTRDELRDLACMVWLHADPTPVGRHLSADDWVSIWSATGYYSNKGRTKPARGLVLYRGAGIDEHGTRGMSWTPNRKLARLFARARHGHHLSAVYELYVEPAAILAIIEPEIYTRETAEWWQTIGSCVEVIVHPAATAAAVRVETAVSELPPSVVRRRNVYEAHAQEFRRV
jgi:hypothetical protein